MMRSWYCLSWRCSPLRIRHPEPNGSRWATPPSLVQQRPGHSRYIAAGFVFVTFWMKTMVPLRLLGIGSNIFFIAYGYLASAYPPLLLHGRDRGQGQEGPQGHR